MVFVPQLECFDKKITHWLVLCWKYWKQHTVNGHIYGMGGAKSAPAFSNVLFQYSIHCTIKPDMDCIWKCKFEFLISNLWSHTNTRVLFSDGILLFHNFFAVKLLAEEALVRALSHRSPLEIEHNYSQPLKMNTGIPTIELLNLMQIPTLSSP